MAHHLTRYKYHDPEKHSVTGYRRVLCGNHEARAREHIEWERLEAQMAVSLGNRVRENGKARRGKSPDSDLPTDLDCAIPDLVKRSGKIGGSKETAQIHTNRLAQEPGFNIVVVSNMGIEVSNISYAATESGTFVTLPAMTAILLAGPGTSKLFPSARTSSCEQNPSNLVFPEIYGGPKNEIYVLGGADMAVAVPGPAEDVKVGQARRDDSIPPVTSISDRIRLGPRTSKQAYYLPILNMGGCGGPLIRAIGIEGLLMAPEHSRWGIHNAPATGKLFSEILFEGQTVSVDIRKWDPRRVL
ncbi:hypothetical protein HOY80DRAFT_1096263 [Tuber brumale]|nr:hypothetical protein HOY80DRAFT_1096263 [Tuber brumale]